MPEVVYKHIVVVLGFLAITLLMTLPVATALTTQVAGSGGDPWQTLWRFEHKASLLQEAIAGDEVAGFVSEEFLGTGEARLVNLSVWPWLPLHLLLGQPLTYNVIWLLSFVLSGYFMYLLVTWLMRETKLQTLSGPLGIEAPAVVAGLYYMFLPFHVAHAQGHFGALQTQWLPLAILLLLVFLQRPTLWRAVGVALVLSLQAWSEHHYALWLGILILLAALWQWRNWHRLREYRAYLLPVLVVAGLLVLLVGLPYWPTIQLASVGTSSLSLGEAQTVRFAADPFGYVVPAVVHPVWGVLSGALFGERFTGNAAESVHYLSLLVLLLLIFFGRRIPGSQARWWLLVAAVFFLISLGPMLKLFGRPLGLPLPYAWFDGLPILKVVRAVGRASVMVGLSAAILLGWVVATQVKRRGAVIGLALLILIEFMFLPVPLQSSQLSPAYSVVSQLPGEALIEIPAATNYTIASRALYASSVHGKEVVGSIALERAGDPSKLTEVRSLPALRQLLYLRTTHLRERRPDFFEQELAETLADVLTWLDAKAILIHTDSLSVLQLATIRSWLEGDLALEAKVSDDVVLYSTETLPAGDGVFLARDGRWEAVGYDPERDSTFAELIKEASTTLYNVTDALKSVRLQFTIAPESHGNVQIRTSEEVVTRLTASPGETVSVLLELPPGQTQLFWQNELTEKVILQNPKLEVFD